MRAGPAAVRACRGGDQWLGAVSARPRAVRTDAVRGAAALDNEGVIPILARAVREIESAVERGQAVSVRSRFQAVALLAREERIRVRTDTGLTEAKRDGELKRLDGIATILAQTAAREPSLFSLLAEDAKISDQASDMRQGDARACRRRGRGGRAGRPRRAAP